MLQALSRLRARLGDFWWYSLLIFLAARSGDLIQAFIGLWLVPHYVPQSELGAVQPLLQMSIAWGLPLSILLVPFTKFLNTYATKGELGKVKRLLQIAFMSAIVVAVLSALGAKYVMPLFFERVRVPPGSLGILILATGLLSTFSPVFVNSLQALKRFNSVVVINALGAPVRLVVMLVTMPIRALSGFLLGQIAPSVLATLGALFCLRKNLGKGVKATPFWKEDGWAMSRYTIPVAVNLTVGTLLAALQATLIRQRLPDLESAAFYMISRLADVGTYAGLSLVFVMFPMAAEAHTRGVDSFRLLRKLLLGSLGFGLAVAVAYAVLGRWIFRIVPHGDSYLTFIPLLVLYTVRQAFSVTMFNFTSFETAQNRFRFLIYMIPLALLETVPLVILTGYNFFRGIFPDGIVDWMASINAARLSFFLWWFFAVAVLESAVVLLHLYLRRRNS